MSKLHFGSVILGLLLGILLYHFAKGRVASAAG
jgi:hypothetical protein